MKTVAFVFARGGSKGLPRKNLMNFQGKPLIAHSIEFAKSAQSIDEVVVSTDDTEIAEVSKSYGALVPFLRPEELSRDNSPEMLAWKHAIDFYRNNHGDIDRFISLPTVSPLRELEDLEKIWTVLDSPEKNDFVLSVKESDANPYFNLIEEKESGYGLCCGKDSSFRRQEAKKVFQVIPMYYACKPVAIDKYSSLLDGKISIVTIPKERACDIDTIEDFHYLEYLISLKKK